MTFEELKEKTDPHIGQFVLYDFKVVLFEGAFIDDSDGETCYKFREWGNYIVTASLVCTEYIPLKVVLSENQYKKLEDYWNNNERLWEENPVPIFMNGWGRYVIFDSKSGKLREIGYDLK